jgi:hypothetical protein
VIGALALFYALFLPKPASPGSSAAPPLSTESGPEGLAGASQWLRLEHIAVVSLRSRYGQLDTHGGAGTGNVLIASLPQQVAMSRAEEAALAAWVERGNTLLVLAALDDTPRWARGDGPQLLADLMRMTHFAFSVRAPTRAETLRSLAGPTTQLIEPRGRHPLLAGVQRVQDVSQLPASRWIGTPAVGATALAIAERQVSGTQQRDAVMWVAPRRAGQQIVCAFAAAFSNAQINQADNARLFANIIAWSRAPAGRVIFDDAHQGLVDFYDPQAFFADPRLHATLWWILGVWLVWVLGSQVLRSRQVPWRPVDETALIDASGRFFSARVSAQQAARALLKNFFDEIHRRLRQAQDGTPAWEWLAAQPRVTAAALAQLRNCEARAAAGKRMSLARLHNLLVRLRRSIA